MLDAQPQPSRHRTPISSCGEGTAVHMLDSVETGGEDEEDSELEVRSIISPDGRVHLTIRPVCFVRPHISKESERDF